MMPSFMLERVQPGAGADYFFGAAGVVALPWAAAAAAAASAGVQLAAATAAAAAAAGSVGGVPGATAEAAGVAVALPAGAGLAWGFRAVCRLITGVFFLGFALPVAWGWAAGWAAGAGWAAAEAGAGCAAGAGAGAESAGPVRITQPDAKMRMPTEITVWVEVWAMLKWRVVMMAPRKR